MGSMPNIFKILRDKGNAIAEKDGAAEVNGL